MFLQDSSVYAALISLPEGLFHLMTIDLRIYKVSA